MESIKNQSKINIEKQWLDYKAKLDSYNRWVFKHIQNYIGDFVLEAGSGLGTYSKYFVDNKSRIMLTDIEDDYLVRLKNLYGKYDNVTVTKLDLTSNLPDQTIFKYPIDTILCIDVLEHVKDDINTLKSIYNVIREDGVFIFTVPNHKWLFNSLDKYTNHYRRYSLKELKNNLIRIGFVIDKAFTFNFFGAMAWFLHGNILRQKIILGKNMNLYNFFMPLVKLADLINPFKIGLSIAIIARKKLNQRSHFEIPQ